MPVIAEWRLHPSRYQRRLDGAFLLLAVALLWPLLSVTEWLLCLIALALLWCVIQRKTVLRLRFDGQYWWLIRDENARMIRWRSGSIRRRDLIIVRWGFWPWQALMIRPDSLSHVDEFRQLQRAASQF